MTASHTSIIRGAYASGLIKGPTLILMLLANHRREGWKLGDLSAVTGFSAPLINGIKDDLVKKGMAVAHYPERDRRVVKVYLTDFGRERANEMWVALAAFAGAEDAWRGASPPQPD